MRISLGLLIVFLLSISCESAKKEPQISLGEYKVEEGFDLSLIASEPFLDAPVAIDFDKKGRIWVAEMPGFMKSLQGAGEREPTGSIKILEDTNDDGRIDRTLTFLDSLVMPRAIKLVYDGLLYAEPPYLWFVNLEDDKPGRRTLVDSTYAPEGNPEYQPNGLVLNIDNWIYSARSNYRYRRKNGKWLKEPTTNRGQWGITHDNFGRLYFNHNSQQLLGDYVLPNRMVRNEYYVPEHAVNRLLTNDQRVYPLHPTAVNRGYAENVLDQDSLLVNVTAACGPQIYRGDQFPEEYEQNAFVCIPEANLIKRNILSFHGDSTSAQQAWQGKEFLASTDEGFRPVNLANGPDGALYIADMHRGVIQHYAFLSPYLKKKSKREQLDTLVGFGRILKVQHNDVKQGAIPDFASASEEELVGSLSSENGWVRDQAQQQLILNNDLSAVAHLKKMLKGRANAITQLHALYTLEGLDALSFQLLKDTALRNEDQVAAHAIVLMEQFANAENSAEAAQLFSRLLTKKRRTIDLYLATTLGVWAEVDLDAFAGLIVQLNDRYQQQPIFTEAFLSGSGNTASKLLSYLEKRNASGHELKSLLTQNINRKNEKRRNLIYEDNTHTMDHRTKGAKLFRQICAPCHGLDGNGMEGIAPPFVNSEYLSGPPERLGLIILHGLTGPVHVDGTRYDLDQAMPGMAGNEYLTDDDISAVIAYVTNAFSSGSKYLAPDKIKELRARKPEDGNEYTEEELLEYIQGLN